MGDCMLGMTLLAGFLLAADHVVGGSIPPSSDLCSVWASNRTFLVGDNLTFRFEMGFYIVALVSRREYEGCAADDPFRTFHVGPAVVPLDAAGVRYFICIVGNYCALSV